MSSSQPRTSTRRPKYPWIGKTVKNVVRMLEDDMTHLRIDFTDGSSVSFTTHAPQPDWDDAAYWEDDDADALNIELPEDK